MGIHSCTGDSCRIPPAEQVTKISQSWPPEKEEMLMIDALILSGVFLIAFGIATIAKEIFAGTYTLTAALVAIGVGVAIAAGTVGVLHFMGVINLKKFKIVPISQIPVPKSTMFWPMSLIADAVNRIRLWVFCIATQTSPPQLKRPNPFFQKGNLFYIDPSKFKNPRNLDDAYALLGLQDRSVDDAAVLAARDFTISFLEKKIKIPGLSTPLIELHERQIQDVRVAYETVVTSRK
jgi:hypothetical protein